MQKSFRKYKLVWKGVLASLIVDSVALLLYMICLQYMKDQTAAHYVVVNILANILLVIVSVSSATLLSSFLIDVRSKNNLYEEIIAKDVLSEPQFYRSLEKAEQEKMLHGLEANLYFGTYIKKEDMYRSIRKKIDSYKDNDGDASENCYLESCTHKIKCKIDNGFFEKTVLKVMDIRAYTVIDKKNFTLCSTDALFIDACHQPNVESLFINGVEKDIRSVVETRTKDVHDNAFNKKSGYTTRATHIYRGNLHLAPDKPTKIEVCYKTFVPMHDTFYSCRTAYPCHKFDFSFVLSGDGADEYALSVCAFGFVDDGKNTPNQKDNMPEISVNFDNWIFPLDGVAVSMIKKGKPIP